MDNIEYLTGEVKGIREPRFQSKWIRKFETIFAQGNGYMGIRAATEERYTNEKRGAFIAGNFNQFDENEVTELANCPDMTAVEVKVNGNRINLDSGKVEDYRRQIDLTTGEITRSFKWEFEQVRVEWASKRFVSLKDLHVYCHQIELKNSSDKPMTIEIISGIDGQITNSGTQHFAEGDKRLRDKVFLQMMATTSQSKKSLVTTLSHRLRINGEEADIEQTFDIQRRRLLMNYKVSLPPNSSLVLERYATYHTDYDLDRDHSLSLVDWALAANRRIYQVGYEQLLDQSRAKWQREVWQAAPIHIKSNNDMDELALCFAKYHLQIMTPAHDERMNIGAKGLSGEGYKGHTFWDTELFMLPYFTYSQPTTARSLLKYRYLGLEGAHNKARDNGYQGAQYPWEAAWPSDGETTPVWGAADIIKGTATKIWSGFIEQHITGDVAFAVQQYVDITDDQDFMKQYGYEIILDTAKFWASRLNYNDQANRYEIWDVIGPDEYKEHVNNNAFTNYIAHWNMQRALSLIAELRAEQEQVYQELDRALDLEHLETELSDKLKLFYLPQLNQAGILPQDDSYLDKQVIDLRPYKNQLEVGSLFKVYNLEQVNQMQVSKQADVLLLIFLFEHLFDREAKLANWHYYEPKTTHDSSLSLSTHSILASDLGDQALAYRLFNEAISIDMGSLMTSSDDGIHAASLGGIWQMVVFGFGGLRCIDGKLRIQPHLPAEWHHLHYTIFWKGVKLEVNVQPKSFSVTNHSELKSVNFLHHHREIEIAPQTTFELQEEN